MAAKGWSFVGASMGEEEEENGNVRERGRKASKILGLSEERECCFLVKKKGFSLFLLFYFSKALATCPILSGTKRAHLFLLM